MSLAIITGASGGIGREFAKQMKDTLGVDELWLIARREEGLKRLADELGVKTKLLTADLTEREGLDKLREELARETPSVDYLVNCAGFGKFGNFDELPDSEAERMIDLNVKATVLVTNMVIPYMPRGARIVQLGSASCFTPLPNFNIYASSKAFVLHYTKALNYELKKYGIRATCFCPGWVDTEFLGLATSVDGARAPKMKPLLRADKVVRGCLRAVKRGRAMYVTNWFTKLQHLLFKLLPDPILTRAWLKMQK